MTKICRSCGNDDVDPNTGPYELCELCWDGFEQDMYERLDSGDDDIYVIHTRDDSGDDDTPLL